MTAVKNYNQRDRPPPPITPAIDPIAPMSALPLHVSAAEIAQALLAPATPSSVAANFSFTEATPSYELNENHTITHSTHIRNTRSTRRRKRRVESLNGTPSSPSASGRNKGLRHFSSRVCEKVEQKKVTTYNEVRDENLKYSLNWRLNNRG